MIVISGTIDRSWNSSTEKARSPNGVLSRPAERSIGSTCAVEDSASGMPIATAAAIEKPVNRKITPESATPHATTCASPRPKMSRRSRHSRSGCSSRPTRNSSRTMPSSAMPIFCSASPTSPRHCGPITAPATR